MHNNILKTLLVAILSICAMNSYGQCDEKIKEFYVTYMRNSERNEGANVELMKNHMSPELIDKLAEYTAEYDADAVIHAQDVSKYGIESLIVLPLGKDDGYMVQYKWDSESKYTFIPVRATITDGKLVFLDIYPVGSDAEGKSYIKRK